MCPSARPDPLLFNAHLDPLPAMPPQGPGDAPGPHPYDALNWRQARPVIEDAWQALDHLPAPALRVEAH
ncbi:hypothetical protein [Xanthomonas translucens]|uniref:hypothetical protein n=1 Tax=Xanthomonas campestris pv. translucens TaxID=343 RepID=UPI00071E8779|nr:hypothetical protein [Xanthomonas translucens]KTF39198.1 hypothetical protein OZ12_13420 [Xanthomonas translucens pv. translucens]KWV10689.1 hypothetical protein ATB54_19010 [Xanthomonas translucens]MCS3360391.1 hypothetical protein [Xanthomonas translucens pv. translucens]MCS3374185.1 hypothetical protein [Xanthomonas translucens pv. translucens]MCT8276124.1 hypothetical protein [Xanthomonas translucens pv. translucens]